MTFKSTSKEIIKNRMLKHALNYWGIKHTEDLDPAIKLILEALSLELNNLGNEIKDTQVRMLEKVSNLLAPGSLTSPDPAHAILHALPVEPMELIGNNSQFTCQRKEAVKQNEETNSISDICFTPVDNVQLIHAEIRNVCLAGNLHSYQNFNRQFIARSENRFEEHHTIWLGLKTHPDLNPIENMTLYFEWKNLETNIASELYKLLPLCRLYVNDKEIKYEPGFRHEPNETGKCKNENAFAGYDMLRMKETDIRNYYDNRFIYIPEIFSAEINERMEKYPKHFEKCFQSIHLEKLTEKLLWLRIEFPASIQEQYLNDLFVYTNAFPVMNRKLVSLKYRIKGGSNIIPLKTEVPDQFLSVKCLMDDTHEYNAVPFRQNEEDKYGSYCLRSGGVERFDNRNAREQINYLLELLRSESAAFAVYGYDFMATTLKEMNQKISLMEQKTRGYTSLNTEIPNYIIVKPNEGKERMYVEYWTTLSELANNLRAGTRMVQVKGAKLRPESVMLLTTSTGGKNKLKPEERINAIRYGVMTRNRIVSREDIRNFIFFEMGDKIIDIKIEKGYEMSLHRKEGFRRTIDVILTRNPIHTIEEADLFLITEQLKSKLTERSVLVNNYRVIFK